MIFSDVTSIQRIATLAITGGMRTTATDVLEAHANILPIELLMQEVCYRATIRLASLPRSHPLHKPLRACAKKMIKSHPSLLHTLLHMYGINPDTYETVSPASHAPSAEKHFTTEIAESQEESKQRDTDDEYEACVYTDGSGFEGKAGAAAVLYKAGRQIKTLSYCLGRLEDHTTYEAEAVGVTLGLELLKKERRVTSAAIKLDNQSVIQSARHVCP